MKSVSYDVVALGDFRCADQTMDGVAEALVAISERGYHLGLLQLKGARLERPLPRHRAIQALIEQSKAVLVDPDLAISARMVIATDPLLFTYLPRRSIKLEADQKIVHLARAMINDAGQPVIDLATINRHARQVLNGAPVYAPVSQSVREQLAMLLPDARLTEQNWGGVIGPDWLRKPKDALQNSRPVLGWYGDEDALSTAWDRTTMLSALPADPRFIVRLAGGGDLLRTIAAPLPRNWHLTSEKPADPARFLETIDFFIFPQTDPRLQPFDHAILQALAAGVVTLMPKAYEPIFGEGAVYAEPQDMPAVALALHGDREAFAAQSAKAIETVRRRFSRDVAAARVEALIGAPAAKRAARIEVTPPPRRAMFVTINGVGMGHLTRMLAIARRCRAPVQPVFATMSQGLSAVHAMGFLGEYIPSRGYIECDLADWNRFLTEDLDELIGFYDPAIVLFDGNVPYQGFMDVMPRNPDPWFVWVRRAMWRSRTNEVVTRQRFFDAVLEPGELAEAYDHGVTTRERTMTRSVGPIRLLDNEEMLPRDEARAALGLEDGRPAVLLQLGAGNNFDYRAVFKTAFTHLNSVHGAQAVIGEWMISDEPVDLPDTVIRMPGYPFARYFNAFDLAISAVGYNSFHELLYAGVPTIFIPNEAAQQDNQLARALYAARHGLGACVRRRDIYEFTAAIDRLLNPDGRAEIKARLAEIGQENGAKEAAALVEEMAFTRRVDRA